jgi:hypothetical protein
VGAAAASSFTTGSVRESFTWTANGGFEDDVVLVPDFTAIERLRVQTRQRARAFAHGEFVDPTNPHGDLVPGLREMHGQWGRIHVRCEDLPNGARVKYMSHDPVMVEALHQWFTARIARKIR